MTQNNDKSNLTKKNKKGTPESRRKMALAIAAGFLLVVWGFVLGVLVGRNSIPTVVTPTQPQISMEAPLVITPENETKDESTASLDFYQELSKKDEPVDQIPTVNNPVLIENKSVQNIDETKQETEKSVETKKTTPKITVTEKEVKKVTKPEPVETVKPKQTVSKTTQEKSYSLQAAAFKVRSEAMNLARKLQKKTGMTANVLTVDLKSKGIWHRVRLGSFETRAKAVLKAKELKSKGIDTIVVTSK